MSSCSGSSCPSQKGAGQKSAKTQIQDELISSTLAKITYKIFVMSGKGGVGKSSIAVNLAAALAGMGHKVGLMDVDIHGPSVPTLMGLSGQLDVDRGSLIMPKKFNENLHVVSMESLLKDPDQAVLWRGPMKTSAIRQFISDVQWGELDFLVVDSPPGTGDEPMTVLKTIPEALCVVVTTPQEVSLADVRKSVNFLQYARANVLGVVENMSGLACPHCGESIDLFKKGAERIWPLNMGWTSSVPCRLILPLWWRVTWARRWSCLTLILLPKPLCARWRSTLLKRQNAAWKQLPQCIIKQRENHVSIQPAQHHHTDANFSGTSDHAAHVSAPVPRPGHELAAGAFLRGRLPYGPHRRKACAWQGRGDGHGEVSRPLG